MNAQRIWNFALVLCLGLACLSFSIAGRSYTPIGEDDYAIVVADNSVIFDVLENDSLNGEFRSLHFYTSPKLGHVYVNDDWTITYVPQPGICGESDQFEYIVQTDIAADTVAVYVEILCEPLTIMSGFSPNGDGLDDHFTIYGIENFPNNTLHIFNSSGQQVLERIGYANDWNGMLDNGEMMSEHEMYYYVFSDGVGRFLSGYIQIHLNE